MTLLATTDRLVVVGGGVGGAHACRQARRHGFAGTITLLTDEDEHPYDRPPLSKAVLTGHVDDTRFPVDYAQLGIDVRTGVAATALDVDRGVVATTAGDVHYDGLVIATGAQAIRLRGAGEQLLLRTRADALALRDRLIPDARIVIIGASWTGAEVATVALANGCRVSCVEAGATPLAQALGEEVGASLLGFWEGVDLRLGAAVAEIEDNAVRLTTGERLVADVVVVGVGVRPRTDWLESSGLALDRGVLVDGRLRSSASGVVAVGDVAAWWSERWGQRMRIAHWDDAVSGPATAVQTLLDDAGDRVHDPVPYFWSDQFGHKLQYVGHHDPGDERVLRGPHDAPKRSVTWLDAQGRLTALLAIDNPRDTAQARVAIASGLVPDTSLLADVATPIRALENELLAH